MGALPKDLPLWLLFTFWRQWLRSSWSRRKFVEGYIEFGFSFWIGFLGGEQAHDPIGIATKTQFVADQIGIAKI